MTQTNRIARRRKELRARRFTREVKTNQSRPQHPTRNASTNTGIGHPQPRIVPIPADVVKVNTRRHASLTAVQARPVMIHLAVLVLIVVKLGTTEGQSGNIGSPHPILPQAAVQVAQTDASTENTRLGKVILRQMIVQVLAHLVTTNLNLP